MTIQGEKGRQRRENRVVATKFGQGHLRVSQDNAQTVAAAGEVIEFDTVDYDVNGWFNTTNWQYTPKSPGMYLVIASVSFAATPDTGSSLWVYKNGAAYKLIDRTRTTGSTGQRHFRGTCMVEMDGVADYITIFFDPNTQQATDGAVEANYLHIVQIGYNKP